MLTRHTAQLSQLREIKLQLGVRRRPLPDLQQLMDAGRALEAGKLHCWWPTRRASRLLETLPTHKQLPAAGNLAAYSPASLPHRYRLLMMAPPSCRRGSRHDGEHCCAARPPGPRGGHPANYAHRPTASRCTPGVHLLWPYTDTAAVSGHICGFVQRKLGAAGDCLNWHAPFCGRLALSGYRPVSQIALHLLPCSHCRSTATTKAAMTPRAGGTGWN